MKKLFALLLVLTVAVPVSVNAGGNAIQLRGYSERGGKVVEWNPDTKAPTDCIQMGKKWLEGQGQDAYYTCGFGCEVRPDGSSACNRLCEFNLSGQTGCEDKEVVFSRENQRHYYGGLDGPHHTQS